VRGADREAESVGSADSGHGGDFGGGTLCVSDMVLADFFADGDDDALPADHGAEAESDGDFYPQRNEARGAVDVGFVVFEDGDIGGGELRLAASCIMRSASLVRYMSLRKLRTWSLGTLARPLHWAISVPTALTSERMASMVLGLNSLVRMNSVTSSRGIADGGAGIHILVEGLGCLLRHGDKVLALARCDGMVEGVGCGNRADEDEHDEAHALLSVVGAVEEADAGAGEDEEAANPEGRRLRPFGGFVELLFLDDGFHEQQEQGRADAANNGRDKQRFADVGGLRPVDAAGAGAGGHEWVSNANADDGTDQRVGAGGRESEIPGTKIPEDGGNEESEDHGEAGAAAELQDGFDGQERDDAEGDRDVGIERVSINNGGHCVGGVVEAPTNSKPRATSRATPSRRHGKAEPARISDKSRVKFQPMYPTAPTATTAKISVPMRPGPLANFSWTAEAPGTAGVEGDAATVAIDGFFALATCDCSVTAR